VAAHRRARYGPVRILMRRMTAILLEAELLEITAPVVGLSGRTAMVTSAWKIEDDGPVQLVTNYPGEREGVVEQDEALEAGDPADLYAIAVEVAAQACRNCRPTPLALTGGTGTEIIAEGMAGFA